MSGTFGMIGKGNITVKLKEEHDGWKSFLLFLEKEDRDALKEAQKPSGGDSNSWFYYWQAFKAGWEAKEFIFNDKISSMLDKFDKEKLV